MDTQFHFFFFFLLFPMSYALDYTDLVYRGCADQNFQDPTGSYTKTLRNLFDSLISQSAKTNFSKTTATGNDGGKDSFFGLYQCRGDLSGVDCENCVSQFPKLARKLCGDALAARVQLVGCYMRYEIVGFKQVSSTEELYKYCKRAQAGDPGFNEKRDGAFEEVQNGVASGNGFYAASYGSLFAMGQCEGDLEAGDCEDCVNTALQRVKDECGEAIQGQVYLNQCYVSYSYYPNGVGGSDNEKTTSTPGTKHNTAKTVAIVVGATAAAGFGVVLLLFTRSVLKKRHTSTPKYYYEYGG